jgi:hypothetical protein
MQPEATQPVSVIATQPRLRLGHESPRSAFAPAHLSTLPAIPVVDVGPDFPSETLAAAEDVAHALLDGATRGVPVALLKRLDAISRRWLVRQSNPSVPEIDALAARLGRPGGHFLSVNYEWGCTVGVGPCPDGRSARLTRTLDWFTPGLGRHVMAARVSGPAGPFVTLTWPGFVGVLQAMAPGRFSASINQAPLRRAGGGLFALDWMAAKARVWRSNDRPAAHVLRTVMETARDYGEARRMLIETPVAAPVTFSLAGIAPHDACIIERTERQAHVVEGPACVTNHWQALDHGAHARGIDSEGRLDAMQKAGGIEMDAAFPWLKPPVLNALTRLAMVADAAEGRLVAQGFEDCVPATRPLELSMNSPASTGRTAAAAE